MSRDYESLHDPNAEYTMRELSAETMETTGARGGGRDVEITDVQTTMVDGNFPWTLVRVYTDAGVVGTGEAYWGAGRAPSAPIVSAESSRIVYSAFGSWRSV